MLHMTETEYIAEYARATKRVLELATKIDREFMPLYGFDYSLVDIVTVLRNKYKEPAFRHKYVGNMPYNDFIPYTKGFCALTTICIYELYGGGAIWEPSAIKLGTWEHAPVVFLRERSGGRAFDPTADQFAPLVVPYNIGTPINKRIQDMSTPKKNMFVKEIKQELSKR